MAENRVVFKPIQGQELFDGSGSTLINLNEKKAVIDQLVKLKQRRIKPSRIAVITFYQGQRRLLAMYFRRFDWFKNIEIASVDSFQG